jgi:hypothetical protein
LLRRGSRLLRRETLLQQQQLLLRQRLLLQQHLLPQGRNLHLVHLVLLHVAEVLTERGRRHRRQARRRPPRNQSV